MAKRQTRGDVLRKRILAEYNVEGVDQEVLLDLIVRTSDEIELLERAIDEHGPLIMGARGQLVRSPAVDGLVKHRRLLSDLVARAFPSADAETATVKARRAARARWEQHRGVR